MKNLLFFLFVIVFIASCNNYETFTITSAEYTTNQKYEIKFIKTFGTPSPNQEWGLTSAIVLLTKRASVGIQEKRSKWNASLICSICLLVL